MYIYNVTTNIDESIIPEWVEWMQTEHIPEVIATGCFTECRLCRIIAESQGGKAYSAQFIFPNLSAYHRYQTQFAPALKAKTEAKFGQKVASFRTVMEILD